MEILVVIVNYRSAELTLQALRSLARERANSELSLSAVVVENASGDEARLAQGIAAEFSEFARLVISPVNGGFGAGNNLGLRSAHESGARPHYVHFLNPDTEVKPGAVLALARFLEQHPRAGLASGSFEFQDGTLWPFAFRFPTPASELEAGCKLGVVSRLLRTRSVTRPMGDKPEQIDWCPGASMMVRRAVLETVGSFDESYFLYYEEVDLCSRIKAAGWEVWYVPESRVMHVCGQSTGVTALGEAPRRLPSYWFESRRRYFVKHHGVAYTALTDLASLLGSGVGALKDVLKGTPRTPHLLRDLARESVVWPQHRRSLEPARCYTLPPLRQTRG